MPIYVVGERNQRVAIPSHALSVSISGSVDGAELEVRAGRGQPVVGATAHQVVLPSLVGPVALAVRPVGAQRFEPGTVVHLAIVHDNPDDLDPVQVVFDPVDVSGETGVIFAELVPRGSQIEVSVSAVADTALSPLGAAARTSARNVVGRGAARSAGAVVVAVDVSASMRPWFADGCVAAAADIVVGVADALGWRQVSAVLVGANIAPIGPAAGLGLADALRAVEPRWSAGARWSRLSPGPAHTIVCADFVPLAVQQRFAVINFSNDRRRPAGGAVLPSPRPGHDVAAELVAYPAVLDGITANLVRALT